MCSACGFPAVPGHWTEAGASDPHARLRSRHRRIEVLRKVLHPVGLRASDAGSVPGFQLASASGQRVLMADLDALWSAVETLSGRVLDPLDPRYLDSP